MLTEQEVKERLRTAIVEAGGQRKFAEAHSFTVAYINDVVHGRRALADRILAVIGVERKTVYQVTYQDKNQG